MKKTARAATTYRAARRNEARRLGLNWRTLDRIVGVGQRVNGQQTVLDRLLAADPRSGKKTVVRQEIPVGIKYGTIKVVLP